MPLIEILDPQFSLRIRGRKGDVPSVGGDGDTGIPSRIVGADAHCRRKGKTAQGGFGRRLAKMDECKGQCH